MSDLMQITERPIIFTGSMVKAILERRKTQTRRVIRFKSSLAKTFGESIEHTALKTVYPARLSGWVFWDSDSPDMAKFTKQQYETGMECPYGKPPDRLWVRETWGLLNDDDGTPDYYQYKADTGDPYPGRWPSEEAKGNPEAPKWRPSIFMPRSISRITLEINLVKVERLQAISVYDCLAEGILSTASLNNRGTGAIERDAYAALWDQINAKRGFPWKSNPWVWVIGFRRLQEPS